MVESSAQRTAPNAHHILVHILSLSGLIALVRVAGFFEKQLLAARFGATATLDVYFIAVSLPMMVFFGATALLSPTFLPVFVRRLEEGERQRAWSHFRAWRIVGWVVLCVLVGAAVVWSEPLAGLLGPGLTSEARAVCSGLIRVLAPAGIVLGALPLTSSALNAHRRFGVTPVGEILIKAGTVGAVVFFSSLWGIRAAAVGFVAGAVLAACLHTYQIRRLAGHLLRFRPGWSDPDFRYVLYLMLAPGLGTAFARLGGMVENAACSTVAPGAITALELARKIVNLPLLVVPLACGTVLYTLFAELRKRERPDDAARLLGAGLRGVLYFLLPLAALCILLAHPVVAVVYERGHFDADATARVALVLAWLAPEMCFEGVELLIMRYYFSREELWGPTLIGIACAVLKIALIVGLVGTAGVVAVAGAIVASRAVKVVLLVWLLRARGAIRWQDLELGQLARLVPCLCAGLAMAAAMARVSFEIFAAWPAGRFIALATCGLAGFGAYAGVGLLVGLRESRYLAIKLGWRST